VDSRIQTLIKAATLAPSGDNTQPWKFSFDPIQNRIDLFVDPARDPSPMNRGQRMARIAVGAALVNLQRTAQHNGWPTELISPERPALASIRLVGPGPEQINIEHVLTERVTNRRFYNGQPLSEAILSALQEETPAEENVQTLWMTDRTRLPNLGRLIGQGDALMFGVPSMRKAFLANIRFDSPALARVDEGLSLASLELSSLERPALSAMKWLPNWLIHYGGGLRAFATKAQRLVESASGLCLILANDDSEKTDQFVGQATQRAWLALTRFGLAAQPMMSLPVLENAIDKGSEDLISPLRETTVKRLIQEVAGLILEVKGSRVAFLLRFGFAPFPSGRTGRIKLSIHEIEERRQTAFCQISD
jgi:hypothetical protein